MPLFIYDQNNSGGYYRGPAQVVMIEAPNAAEANARAEERGLYFDGAGDCPCCGYRWSEADRPECEESLRYPADPASPTWRIPRDGAPIYMLPNGVTTDDPAEFRSVCRTAWVAVVMGRAV